MGPKIEIEVLGEFRSEENTNNEKYDAYTLKNVKRNLENIQFNVHALKTRVDNNEVPIKDFEKCKEKLNGIEVELTQLMQLVTDELTIAELIND